jgi:hypothetical protein
MRAAEAASRACWAASVRARCASRADSWSRMAAWAVSTAERVEGWAKMAFRWGTGS